MISVKETMANSTTILHVTEIKLQTNFDSSSKNPICKHF